MRVKSAGGRLGGAAMLAVALALSAHVPGGRPARPAAAARPAGGGTVEVVYETRTALRTALAGRHARIVRLVPQLHLAEVRSPRGAAAFARTLGARPGIVSAGTTVPRSAATAPAPALELGLLSTPFGGAYEWQYYATGVDRVPADVLAAARNVTIAVLDTGADPSVSGLAAKIAGTYDARTGRRRAEDRSGHGTFVSSLAAGSSSTGSGVAGFGGDARLLVVKVGEGERFDDVDVAAGIVYAVRHGAKIVNLSVAGRRRSAVEQAAVAYAATQGVLLVAAVGNDALAGNPPEYPAALIQPVGSNGAAGVGLSVGASDFTGRRARFSEFGSFVSMAAPGASVFGALSPRSSTAEFRPASLPGAAGAYGFASGTSFAAPEVAGAAALVWAAAPEFSARRVARILELSASGAGSWTPELGFGVLDVARAVATAQDRGGA